MERITGDQVTVEQSNLPNSRATSNNLNAGFTQEHVPFIVVGTHHDNIDNEQV